MVNKFIKQYSPSYVIREVQIELIMRYHFTPIRRITVQKADSINAGEDMEHQELSSITGGNAKWLCHFGRQTGGFLQSETTSYHMS